jgi:anion-transporting  ArsA/GET3 family ATPase
MGFKHPLVTVDERTALDRAEASFDLIRSYAWPVSEPLLVGLEPAELDDEQRAALEEAERDRAAQAPHEFKPIVVVRETNLEGEL